MTVRKMEHVALGVTAIAVVVLCSSLMQCAAMPAPPSDAEGDIRSLAELLATKMFEDAARNSRSPAATNQPAPTSAIALEPISLDAFASSDSNLDSTTSSLIQSATLISHIKSEGDQPFTTVTGARRKTKSKSRNENIPTTSPNVLLVSQAQVTDDKQSSKSQSASNSQSLSNSQSSANSQSSTNSQSLPNFQLSANSQSSPNSQAFSHSSLTSKPSSNVANVGKSLFDNDGDLLEATRAFTLPNLQTVINPPFRTPVLDVDDVDDDDLLLLQLLGSRMNQAGFKSEQSITPAIKLGSSLNLGPPSSFRTPLNTNSISTSPASESRASPIPGVFTDDNKIVIDLGTLGGVGAPLPLLSGTGNRQENFFTVKEIGSGRNTAQAIASNRPTPTLVTEAGQPVDARMTVGDLIRSLDGLNGIQVLSLSDLRNQQKQAAVSTTGTTIAERLRDAMLSGTPTNGFQNVGVPLPSGNLGNANQVGISSSVQATSGSAGRQADQTATDSLTADSIFDNFFDESSVNSGASSNVGVPLPTVTDNATPADTTSDSFLTTTSDDTNGFPLEDNTNFDFEEYDDDVSSLPAQPESVFRRGISDIFFTKGQWLGTLFGGVIDVGSAVGDSVSKLFNKSGSGSST
ncbi:chitinase-like protein PB1E7.04c isoform X2 [Hyalella azteca]|uniref:Chitinase-like protein PB1E7.04c isoform X2 n=1 Tax=Hyalella azteca TaxID=294128 RepID=A0A8B7PNC3_HYAAZ|nr:chitinase-like protein PB1E7.04c isoform X2 [Hyalella azteca]